ncbi:MAG: hypothetical protein ACOYMW_14480 [Candidatus Competibacteraceae bacterium]
MVPKPIYELLPYAYMLLGLLVVISLEASWGKLCGIILIGTGIVVQQLRTRHRTVDRLFRKRNRGGSQPPKLAVAVTKEEPQSRQSMPERHSKQR